MDTLIVPMETLIVLLYAPKRSYCMHRNIKRTGLPLRTRLRIALVWSSLVCMHASWGGICTSLLWQSAVDVRCRPVLGASCHPVPLITRLETARILPLPLRITYPVLRTGPMIPAYDFGPVGGGVTFLPKGKREGSCARSSVARLHRPVMSGAYLLRRSRANPSAVAGPGLREARRSRTATSPIPVPVSLNVLWSYTPGWVVK